MRSLNVTELNQLDAMMDRTSPGAIVQGLAALCEIASTEPVYEALGATYWETRLSILNEATDKMNREGV